MSRPCECNRVPATRGGFVKGEHCVRCWWWAFELERVGRRAKRAGAGAPATPKARGRCAHLGRKLVRADRIALNLAPWKDWHECDRGHGAVCPCGACKTCPDFEPQ